MTQKQNEQLARMWREIYRKMEGVADESVDRKIGRVIVGGKVSGGRLSGPIPESSLPEHADRHSAGGDDPLAAESLATNETNDALVLRPDGGGGVQWDSESPGGVSEITDLPTVENDTDLVLRPDGSGGVAWGEGGTGGAGELDDLTDVDTTGKDDGDVLTWNAGESEWQAQESQGGGGGTPEPHANSHEQGGTDEIEVSALATSESDTSVFLRPDGSGGVVWGTPQSELEAHAETHEADGSDPISGELDALARTTLVVNGDEIGSRRRVDLNAGDRIVLDAIDDDQNERTVVTITATAEPVDPNAPPRPADLSYNQTGLDSVLLIWS